MRSAFFWPAGVHAMTIAGIKFNRRNPNSSKLIIYDPMPVNKGAIYDKTISSLLEFVKSAQKAAFSNSESALQWKKHGWYGNGSYFLHR
jgi:hypothetical protein